MFNLERYVFNLGEGVADSFCHAKSRGFDKESIVKLSSLLESFTAFSRELGDRKFINESVICSGILESVVDDGALKTLNESFFNPFDNEPIEKEDEKVDSRIHQDGINIEKIRLWKKNRKDKVFLSKGKVISGRFYERGDVIETCPVKIVSGNDLYGKAVRDMVFELDPKRNLYGIPFGFANFYRNSFDCGVDGNAEYSFDENSENGPVIDIVATKTIRRGEEIVLCPDESDFYNEVKGGQFKYNQGPDAFYSIKKFTIA